MPKRPQSPRASASPAVSGGAGPSPRDVHKRQATQSSGGTKDSQDGSQASMHTRGSLSTMLSVASARRTVAKNGNRNLVGAFATFGILLLSALAIAMMLAPGHHNILMNTYNDILPRYIELRSAHPDVCTLEAEQVQPAPGFPVMERCVETSQDLSGEQQSACLQSTRDSARSSAFTRLRRRLFAGGEEASSAPAACPSDGCLRWETSSCPCAASVDTDEGLVPAIVTLEHALGQTFPSAECAARCSAALALDTWPQITTYAPGKRAIDQRHWSCSSPTGPHRSMEEGIDHIVGSLNNGTQLECLMPLQRERSLDCTVMGDGRILFGQRAVWIMVRRAMDAVSVNKRVENVKRERSNATRAEGQAGRSGQDATDRESLVELQSNSTQSASLTGKQDAMLLGYKKYPIEPVRFEYFVKRENAMHGVGRFFLVLIVLILMCSCCCFWLIFWAQEVEKKLFAAGDKDAWDPSQHELRPMFMQQPPPGPQSTTSPRPQPLEAIAEDPSAKPSTAGGVDISGLNPPEAPPVSTQSPRDATCRV